MLDRRVNTELLVNKLLFFETNMPHYMKQEITDTMLSSIDSILTSKQQIKNNNFQNFIAIGSLLLAILGRLPSIHDTLRSLRESLTFLPQNIPHISIDNTSVILWLLLNVYIIYHIFKKK